MFCIRSQTVWKTLFGTKLVQCVLTVLQLVSSTTDVTKREVMTASVKYNIVTFITK